MERCLVAGMVESVHLLDFQFLENVVMALALPLSFPLNSDCRNRKRGVVTNVKGRMYRVDGRGEDERCMFRIF